MLKTVLYYLKCEELITVIALNVIVLDSENRAVVTFGLNALRGRIIQSDGSARGAWDSSNAESLMRYTVNKGYKIYGWELGKIQDFN